eukprot:TRINITY_DN3232_c2_g1_i1.p1 TRINITY_DN3232_c2_g1~~TRINITY_DN3232_c2_g1_i1.p1  ORF type:complete len:376 (+),score=56.85 TRINITY_DN3232_c2_g1_i1:140-1267(+)
MRMLGDTVVILGLVLAVSGAEILHEAETVAELPLHKYNHQHGLTIGVDLVHKRAMLMRFEEAIIPESLAFHGNRKILQDCGYDPTGLIAIDCGPSLTPSPESQIEFSEGANSNGSSAFVGQFVEPEGGSAVEFETIVGDDDRQRVKNTELYPYRTIGRLFFKCNGKGQACTATLIGPRAILTAAHCIYSRSIASTCDGFEFSPGQQADFKPFETAKATRMFYPASYAVGNTENDYGVLILDSDIGKEAGWMGFGYQCSNTVQDLETAGYPNDQDKFSKTMFRTECLQQQIIACPCLELPAGAFCPQAGQSITFKHSCDTFSGQSGSPMWTEVAPNFPQIRGIHSSGFVAGSFVELNTAVVIGQVVYAFSKDTLSS